MNIFTNIPFPIQIMSVFLLGLSLGSFANVCIYRFPKDKSVVVPRSHCQSCKEKILIRDNIPVLSFLLLGGKCRKCSTSIPILYPVVEVSTALLLLAGFIKLGVSMKFSIFCLIGPALLTVTIIDIKHKIIPDSITLP